MDPVTGAIGALGNIASSFISNAGSKKRQSQANQDNINFWNMQNEYNHPSAQMARLRESGLNPNLIYGTPQAAAVGNAESIAPSKAAPYKMENFIPSILTMGQVKQAAAQTDNLRTQNTVLEQERQLKETQNKQQQVNLALSSGAFDYDLDARKSLMLAGREAARQAALDTNYKDMTLDNRVQQVKQELRYAQAHATKEQFSAKVEEAKKELAKYKLFSTDNEFLRLMFNKENLMEFLQKNKELQRKRSQQGGTFMDGLLDSFKF